MVRFKQSDPKTLQMHYISLVVSVLLRQNDPKTPTNTMHLLCDITDPKAIFPIIMANP